MPISERPPQFPAPVAILILSVADRLIRVQCADDETAQLVSRGYGAMRLARTSQVVNLDYRVGKENPGSGYYILRDGLGRHDAQDEAEFLFIFEKDLEIELQKLRRDLFFVHAAVLEFRESAIIFPASSGSGKSMLAWALLHEGLQYLSDELAPVDPSSMEVWPYPHALCLKNEPPEPYPLPLKSIRTALTLHVPVPQLPGGAQTRCVPLAAIFFPEYRPAAKLSVKPISAGAAAARLYANALNPLAHPGSGLDAAIDIAKSAACYELQVADLRETCAAVVDVLKKIDRR